MIRHCFSVYDCLYSFQKCLHFMIIFCILKDYTSNGLVKHDLMKLNWPDLFYYSLASERSERDTLRSVQLRIADIYINIIYILWYVQNLFL